MTKKYLEVTGVTADDVSLPDPTVESFRTELLNHLAFTVGTDPEHATAYAWRMALSFTIRDYGMEPWFLATRRTWKEGRKRVYYLSMEFLIGRLLEDATINLGLRDVAARALEDLGIDFSELVDSEPDAALGNGGLGRLAACYMESMATLGCPAYGYGIRYEHGLFKQRFEGGQQVEAPEDWLNTDNPWNFSRPESAYEVAFGGWVEDTDDGATWHPSSTVIAEAHDTPVIGWGGSWGNTLRLWAAKPTTLLDLERFNAGDYSAAAEPENLARTLSRVLYPDDTTENGKRLRLSQEYFLTSAAIQDILRRYLRDHDDLHDLPDAVAIQMNDTHPAIAGPELVRLFVDVHELEFADAVELATKVLSYTNHTLLPEALEKWSVGLMQSVLPRHMQIIEQIDAWHAKQFPERAPGAGIVVDGQVHMGSLAFIMSHRINGVSALHSELVKKDLFPELDALHPDRIVNVTNGVTPRRWIRLANPSLSALITETIGKGWEADIDRLKALEAYADDEEFLDRFGETKRLNKLRLATWFDDAVGVDVNTAALFDVQVKRMHEYKRQYLNILQTIAHWQRIKENPGGDWVPRVKVFGGKAAPGYYVAKQVIRLINDVAEVVNNDPQTKDLLTIIYPPNYNVSMAEKFIPAADLSEQISTAGMEASGTGNMKFALNGALTIGTLDGANVEIRELVGEDNFFLFGLTTEQVAAELATPDHARKAIEASETLKGVLALISEGRFSPDEKDRYGDLLNLIWNDDRFLVASDFDAYDTAQGEVDARFVQTRAWQKSAVLNTAQVGFFSSDRSIREYMRDIWDVTPAL